MVPAALILAYDVKESKNGLFCPGIKAVQEAICPFVTCVIWSA